MMINEITVYKHPMHVEWRMHPALVNLTTAAECELVASNVDVRDPCLAQEARRRAVELRAKESGAANDLELDALTAVFAYEAASSRLKGRRVRAHRTWQMIARHGIVGAVVRAVDRPEDAMGYKTLQAMGMQDLTFEAVVVKHSEKFDADVVRRCRERLAARGVGPCATRAERS